jgi:hypothetical protein
MDLRGVEQVLAQHRDALMAVPGVVGTAIGASGGRPCIRVFVDPARFDARVLEPAIDDVPVMVEPTGPFIARRRRQD